MSQAEDSLAGSNAALMIPGAMPEAEIKLRLDIINQPSFIPNVACVFTTAEEAVVEIFFNSPIFPGPIALEIVRSALLNKLYSIYKNILGLSQKTYNI